MIFVAGSILAGFSTSAATLISARAVQAIGAAFIMPSTLSTVNAVFRRKYRAAAFGVWVAVISGAAVGPLAGGALPEWVFWHWIFLVNVPVCIIAPIGAVLTVHETRSPDKLPGVDVNGAQLRPSPLPPWFLRLLRAPTWAGGSRNLHLAPLAGRGQ